MKAAPIDRGRFRISAGVLPCQSMTEKSEKPNRWRRRLIVGVSSFVMLLLLVALLLPFILKRYIEAHSEEWIDRRVTIDRIVLNPFTLTYGVSGVTCYEPQSEEVFLSWKWIGLRCNLWAGFQKNDWRFKGLRVEDPYFHIVQQGDRFNFSDLLELGGTDTSSVADTSSVLFNMTDISLTGGRIDYASDILHAPVSVIGLEATCTRISSELARMDAVLGFDLKSGGRMDASFMIDTETSAYGVNAHLRSFALDQLLPYLQEFFDCSTLTGSADVDLNVLDNYADTTRLSMSAGMVLSSIELVDPHDEKLFTLKNGRARLDTLVSKEERFDLGAVRIDGADLRFTMFADGSDNWTRLLKLDSTMVGDSTTTVLQVSESNVFVMLADYVSYLGQQVIASEYTADSMTVEHSVVDFEDHTPTQPFRYRISEIAVSSQRVSTEQAAGRITATATLQEVGHLKAAASFDPKDLRNVTLDMDVDNMLLHQLEAYGRWYAAHPLEDGALRYVSHTVLNNGFIDSQNNLRVDRLKVGKKVDEHDPEIYVLPLRLAAGLLKDVHGVVELDVPVKGDLKDPEFRVWPIIWQVLKNLVVKAVSAPGKLLVRALDGADEADLEHLRFEYLQAEPGFGQKKGLRQLASALKAKPELSVALIPIVDVKAEQQMLAAFSAKRIFLFGDSARLSAADSVRIDGLSSKDSSFTRYVEERTPALSGKPNQERFMAIAGKLVEEWHYIEEARREHVMQFLLAEGITPARVVFREGTSEELVGELGAPGYRFIYDIAD